MLPRRPILRHPLSAIYPEHAAALDSLPDAAWRQVLQFAASAAALNCLREGANPPTLVEVRAALDARAT